ncbi:MAG TPA: hypothetical protein VMX97_16725 [Hyphomicrobiaceae bacterium]|nr:hypothetical protein [Hyphomicrobiaceae bacterium]
MLTPGLAAWFGRSRNARPAFACEVYWGGAIEADESLRGMLNEAMPVRAGAAMPAAMLKMAS